MNITRLNTLNDDKVIIRGNGGNSGGGGGSTIEYVDITAADENLKTNMMNVSIATKAIVMGELVINPSAGLIAMINHLAPVYDILAASFDFNMALLSPQGELLTLKDNLIASGDWETYSSLPRITKEEFYHIPQDEIWTLNTQEDYDTAWNKLYPLVERYGADYINENQLSLAPWYKSLTINDEVVTQLYWYSHSGNQKAVREVEPVRVCERILFTKYTGIEKYTYTDGSIEYQPYNPPPM